MFSGIQDQQTDQIDKKEIAWFVHQVRSSSLHHDPVSTAKSLGDAVRSIGAFRNTVTPFVVGPGRTNDETVAEAYLMGKVAKKFAGTIRIHVIVDSHGFVWRLIFSIQGMKFLLAYPATAGAWKIEMLVRRFLERLHSIQSAR